MRRQRGKSFVAAGPTGVCVRTRLHLTAAEQAALREVGQLLGWIYRRELASRVERARLDRRQQAAYRAERKRALTLVTSSRWAGALTRTVEDQYQLGMRGLTAHVRSLESAVETVSARCTLMPGERAGRITGYRSSAERFQKTRRLAALRARLELAHRDLADARPSITVGGKRLWRTRNNLAAAELTEAQWRNRWEASRLFLTADGESGKPGGNETIRVTGDGRLRLKVPAALAGRLGTHLIFTAPVVFHHRHREWANRVKQRQAVRYDITYDPDRDRWYVDASWTLPLTSAVPLAAVRAGRVLGVDLNDGHLATCVLDSSGNPCGAPSTIRLPRQGLSATRRDGQLRGALTHLLDQAEHAGAGAVVIENLDFADTRATGRETMGRGRRGKRFRRTVASIPTARFRSRLCAMAAQRGLSVVAVDPAYTSKAGGKHWRIPLQQQTSDSRVTIHHSAAVAIGRRGLGLRLSRHSSGPRHARRSLPGQPSNPGGTSSPSRRGVRKALPHYQSPQETGPVRQ